MVATIPMMSASIRSPPVMSNSAVESTTSGTDINTSTREENTPPDGGYVAWLQVLGMWAVFVVTWGLANTFGVFQAYYEKTLLSTTSPSAVSWIGSLQGALLLILGPISGALFDKGHFRQLLLGGLFLVVVGQFMTSLAYEYWHFILAQGVCIGIGCGLAYVPSAALLSQYFRRRQATALGIAATGSPIAGIVFPILFSRLQTRIGFSWTCRALAIIILALSLIPIFVFRVRTRAAGPVRSIVDKSALQDRRFMLFMYGSFFASLSIYIGYFYIQLFAVKLDIGQLDFSAYFVTLLNAGSVPGRLITNYLADHLGHLNIQIAMSALTTIVMFAWMGVHDIGGLVVFSLFYGASTGGIMAMFQPVTVALSSDPSRIGTRMGMVTFTAGFAVLVGPPIGGAILGDYSRVRWFAMIGYAGGITLIATVLFAIARMIRSKKTTTTKYLA